MRVRTKQNKSYLPRLNPYLTSKTMPKHKPKPEEDGADELLEPLPEEGGPGFRGLELSSFGIWVSSLTPKPAFQLKWRSGVN